METKRSAGRDWLVHWLYVRRLAWEFRWPLGLFLTLVFGGGAALQALYHHRQLQYVEACYAVFTQVFLQSYVPFPDEWYLRPFFFVVPLLGLTFLANSVARLGFLVFARRHNSKEWQEMVASTFRAHVIVVGVGKIGARIIKGLVELSEPVVAVDTAETSLLLEETRDLGVAIVQGDGRNPGTLERAGVRHARAIILVTDDDLANLDAALTARDLNHHVKTVLRLFDDTLAAKFGAAFHLPTISPTSVAAPAFIGAATGRKVFQEFQFDGKALHMSDLTIHASGKLVGRRLGELLSDELNVVMHKGANGVSLRPSGDVALGAGDTLLVMAPAKLLKRLETQNTPEGK